MNKLLLSLVLVGVLFSFSPVVKAQEVPQPTQQELTSQLITLLTNLIAQLQQQIADILAQQAIIQQNTHQIVVNTTPAQTVVPVIPQYPTIQLVTPKVGIFECSNAQCTNNSDNPVLISSVEVDIVSTKPDFNSNSITCKLNGKLGDNPIDSNQVTYSYENYSPKSIVLSTNIVVNKGDGVTFTPYCNTTSFTNRDSFVFQTHNFTIMSGDAVLYHDNY